MSENLNSTKEKIRSNLNPTNKSYFDHKRTRPIQFSPNFNHIGSIPGEILFATMLLLAITDSNVMINVLSMRVTTELAKTVRSSPERIKGSVHVHSERALAKLNPRENIPFKSERAKPTTLINGDVSTDVNG